MPARMLLSVLLSGFAVSPVSAQDLFSKQVTRLVDGNSRTLYYESNQNIGIAGDTIERVIVVVHGAGRTNITYERLVDAAATIGVGNETFIFAPQFLIDDDIAANALGPEVLFWPNGWRQGHLSTDNGRGRISSFELVGQVVSELVTNNPAVTDVVIAGHSAGGQYAQRFAATSLLEQDLSAITGTIRVRYVPANPSSMVYVDNSRRIGTSVDQFAIPDSTGCPDYDDYKYGLSGNLNSFVVGIGGTDQVQAQYPLRDVRYLLGEDDNDPGSSSLDGSCAANLQGRQRLERGTVYYNYLRDFFGDGVYDTHIKAISPEIGHTSSIFTADCGLDFLFDIGDCSFVTPTHLALIVDGNSGAVSLSWSDRAAGESGYEIFRSDDGGDTYSLLTTLSADSAAYADATTLPATQYRYRVRTQKDNSRSGFSNTATANPDASTPPPPTPPPAPPIPPADSTSGGGGTLGVLGLLLLLAATITRQLPKLYRKPIE